MAKVYQKTGSDCQKCVLCFLLKKSYEEVPDFTNGTDKYKFREEDKILFDNTLDRYLMDQGYFRLVVKTQFTSEGQILIPYSSKTPMLAVGILQKKGLPFSHAVVIRVTNNKLSIIFDPKEDSDYEVTEITHIEYVFKL